jgi:hypothetical protein
MKILLLLMVCAGTVQAQVGIGTTNPNANLDIRSSNEAIPTAMDGLLIPQLDTFSNPMPTAAQDGLLVYITGDGLPTKGFYYWEHALTRWVALSSVKRVNDLIDGKSDFDGSENGSSIFLGINAGASDDGTNNSNVGLGYESLHSNTTGVANVANGYRSMKNNDKGAFNVAIGASSLFTNSAALYNTAVGYETLYTNLTGEQNVAIGSSALYFNNSGNRNHAFGYRALYRNTIGSDNSAVGYESLFSNISGDENTAVGLEALYKNEADGNTAVGSYALRSNVFGIDNSSIGHESLYSSTEGDSNVAIGSRSLYLSANGQKNVAIGVMAGNNIVSGFNNIVIGFNAQSSAPNIADEVTIGNTDHNTYRMYAASWTNVSDRRLKHNIVDIPVGLELVKKLRPVQFVYNNANNSQITFGFVAQEVKTAILEADLDETILIDQFDQEYLGLRTTELISVLTKAIQEQQAEIETLKASLQEIDTLKVSIGKLENLLLEKL